MNAIFNFSIAVVCLLMVRMTNQVSADEVVSFRRDVMPVFFRAGCNSGSCHGAARGKDGFMLSLFGYDPDGDFYRLTEEYVGRRINPAVPQESLLLQKSIGAVKHTGGKLFDTDSRYYATLLNWIKQGALADEGDLPVVTSVILEPAKVTLKAPPVDSKPTEPHTVQGRVIAKYSDGTTSDVTSLALYLTSNESVVTIDSNARITVHKRGAEHVFARFDKFTVGAEVTVLPSESKFEWSSPPATNYIDSLVYQKLKLLQINPSELCTDEQFVRRAYIDLIGLVPTHAEYSRFITSAIEASSAFGVDANNIVDVRSGYRAALVDELIARPEFSELWAAKWGELLRNRGDTNPGSGTAMKASWNYHEWIRGQFEDNVPLDKFVKAMVRGTGSNFRDAPSNYYNMLSQGHIDALKVSEDTAQLFLGIRTQCAQCHNHPFDRWTMDDYYGWMSFFTGIRRKHGAEAREYYVYNDDTAAPASHPVNGEKIPARFLGGDVANAGGRDPRRALAAWLTSKDNTYFRENMANRIWSHFFGKGVVDPVDDFRISNQPSNAELLSELGRVLAEDHNYNLRAIVRDICTSRIYQLSPSTNPDNKDDASQFSHAYIRRMRADVLLDCIARATETQFRFRRHSATRAVQLFEGGQKENYNMYFLSTFGQAKRETVCGCEDSTEANLSQALHLINGETVNRRAISDSKLIDSMIAEKVTPSEVTRQLFIRCFCREPTSEEVGAVIKAVESAKDARQKKEVYQDLYWALLNSEEFLFNH